MLTFCGRTQTLSAWSRETGLSIAAIRYRLDVAKMSVETALAIPSKASSR